MGKARREKELAACKQNVKAETKEYQKYGK